MLLPGATRLAGTGPERFLSAVAAFFLETARWPTVSDVERILEGRGDRINAQKEARRLCRSLGRLRGDRVVLSVRGLHKVKPKNPVLQGFKAGLDLALERFQSSDWASDPVLSVDELTQKVALGGKQMECVMALMVAESLVAPGGDGVPSTVAPRVRKFRSVETIPEYIAEQAATDRRRCIRHVATGRGRALPALLDGKAVKTVLLSAAGILLAALVLWLGSLVFPSDESDPRRPDAPPAPNSQGPRMPSGESTDEPRQTPALYLRKSAAARSGG